MEIEVAPVVEPINAEGPPGPIVTSTTYISAPGEPQLKEVGIAVFSPWGDMLGIEGTKK